MTKEELKEKYSNFIADVSEILGLGKPIDILKLCQVTDRFFRPLQDKVIDLEKENVQWKQRNETLKDALEHARKVYGDDLEKSYKEIAELKRDKEDLIFIRNQNAKCMCEDKENLVKAKELLKKVIKVTWGEGWNYSLGVKVEAENFLKEIEE